MHNTSAKPQLRKSYQKSYIYEVCLYNCSHNMTVVLSRNYEGVTKRWHSLKSGPETRDMGP